MYKFLVSAFVKSKKESVFMPVRYFIESHFPMISQKGIVQMEESLKKLTECDFATVMNVTQLLNTTEENDLGEWLSDETKVGWICSKCARKAVTRTAFCPNCGKEMKYEKG